MSAPSADANDEFVLLRSVNKLLYVDIAAQSGQNPRGRGAARVLCVHRRWAVGHRHRRVWHTQPESRGVRVANTSSVTVRSLDVSFTGAYGVHVESCTGMVLVDRSNITSAMSNGILVWNSTGTTVRNSIIQNSGFHGISLQGSSSNLVIGNTSFGNAKTDIRSAAGIDVNLGSSENVARPTPSATRAADPELQQFQRQFVSATALEKCDPGFDQQVAGTRYIENVFRNLRMFSVEAVHSDVPHNTQRGRDQTMSSNARRSLRRSPLL